MNLKIYNTLYSFTQQTGLPELSKTTVYKCFDEIMLEKSNAPYMHLFLKAINDRTASYSALEMILAGLQEILPGKNTEKKLSQQISSLRSRFDNDIMSRILAYIEECRNKLTHFGIIPKYDNIQNLYGTDENENYFRLACLIIYTSFRCRALDHKPQRMSWFRNLIYRWRATSTVSYGSMERISWLDGFFGLIPKTIFVTLAIAVITGILALAFVIFAAICGLIRELKVGGDDMVNFNDMNAAQVKEFVMDLSKAERSYFISERLHSVERNGNYYKVGDTIRLNIDTATYELYKMARKNWLPNAHNAWGTLTMTTIGLSHVPVLKIVSQIPSLHLYMKDGPLRKDRETRQTENYDTIELYYSCDLHISKNSSSNEIRQIRDFARHLSKKHKAEYLIIGKPADGKTAVEKARSALNSAGVRNSQIKIIYDEQMAYYPAEVKVRII